MSINLKWIGCAKQEVELELKEVDFIELIAY